MPSTLDLRCLGCLASQHAQSIFTHGFSVNRLSNSSMVLEKVAEYLIYWYRYKDQEDVPDMEIPVELCLEILEAADYLQMDSEWRPQPPRPSVPGSREQ